MHPRGLKPDVSDTSVFLVLAHFHSVCILRHGIDHLTHTRFFFVKLLLVFLLQTILTRPVAMTMKALDDVFAACGVDPSISADLLTEGWTLSTFACCATSMADFETVLPDLCHNFPDITLLQKASLRAAFNQFPNFQIDRRQLRNHHPVRVLARLNLAHGMNRLLQSWKAM